MNTFRLCAGCDRAMPEVNPTGRFRRRDSIYHDERCGRRARYVRDLIRRAAINGTPLPDWAHQLFIQTRVRRQTPPTVRS
jgi:hypothetical protein